jgi:hypothetical protein
MINIVKITMFSTGMGYYLQNTETEQVNPACSDTILQTGMACIWQNVCV